MADYDFNTTFAQRMLDAKPLSHSDFEQMYSWLVQTHEIRPADIVAIRLATQLDQSLSETRVAIERFDAASSKLGSKLNALTWALIFIGVTQLAATIVPLLCK
jgi:hypothetical protein